MVDKSYYDALKEAGDELARLVDENRSNVQGVNDSKPWAQLLHALDTYRALALSNQGGERRGTVGHKPRDDETRPTLSPSVCPRCAGTRRHPAWPYTLCSTCHGTGKAEEGGTG